eukprot:s1136_g1.t1
MMLISRSTTVRKLLTTIGTALVTVMQTAIAITTVVMMAMTMLMMATMTIAMTSMMLLLVDFEYSDASDGDGHHGDRNETVVAMMTMIMAMALMVMLTFSDVAVMAFGFRRFLASTVVRLGSMHGAASLVPLLSVLLCLLEVRAQSVPVQAALAVYVSDSDPQKGAISGNVSIRGPARDASAPDIEFFSVYWGSDTSTPVSSSPVAVVPAVADPSSTRPTCTDSNDGDCGRIVMESTADGWTISRTGRYNNNEYASIELQGPGSMTLTYLDIEAGWDTLCLDGYCFGTNDVGVARSFSQPATLVWMTDSSVRYDGWTVAYTGGQQETQSAVFTSAFPPSTIPSGATHFLVYSGNANGEMAAPLAAEIQDTVALPSPTSLSFSDSSPTPGRIRGLLSVSATQNVDVERIDVYFGAAQTIRLGVCDGVVGYRFEPGEESWESCAGLNKDCSWAGLDLWPLAADSVAGPDAVGGNGLRFDGTFAAVSTIPPDFWAGISNIQWTGWTASAWVYPSVPPSLPVRLLGRSSFDAMFDVFAMQLTPDFLVRCVAAGNPDLGPDACTAPAAQPLLQNTWTHVVCQHEINWMSVPSTGSTFRIFVDGVLVKSCSTGQPYWTQPGPDLTIGGHPEFESFFDGRLDEVAVFDRIVPEAEIQMLRTGYRIASWPAGDTSYSVEVDTAVPFNATTLHAVAVGRWNEGAPLIVDLVDDATPANPPLGVTFTDTDPGAGSFGGSVVVQRASDESDLSHYVAYWGTSPTAKIPGTSELGSVSIFNKSVQNGTAIITLPPGLTPASGASHLVVVSAIRFGAAFGEMATGVGVALQDFAPPAAEAQGISFTDTNPTTGQVSGDVVVTRATDETGVTSYNLYWADTALMKLLLIAKLSASSSSLIYTLTDAVLPAGAAHILVSLEGAGGETLAGVATTGELDYTTLTAPRDLMFQDADPGVNLYGGVIHFRRAAREATVEQYEIHWAQLSGSTASPVSLVETITTASDNETLLFEMIDSYGDGWNGAYYYIRTSTGESVAEGTFFSGYGETHTIVGISAGATLTLTVSRGSWPSEMSWVLKTANNEEILTSATETFPENRQFRVPGTGNSNSDNVHIDGEMVQVTLPSGTSPPAGADQILALSRLTSGSASIAVWVSLNDFAPPSASPTSIQFQDTDSSIRQIAGVISLGRASDESAISGYKVYFGSSATQKLPPAVLSGLAYKLFVFPQGSSLPSLDGRAPTSEGIHASLDFVRQDFGSPEAFNTGFAIRWAGFLHIVTAGTYYFQTFSDGCKVYLHGDVLIDDDVLKTNASWGMGASLFLEQGAHSLQVDYFFAQAPAAPEGTMQLNYWGTDSSDMWMPVPADKLSHGVNETDWIAYVSVSAQGTC